MVVAGLIFVPGFMLVLEGPSYSYETEGEASLSSDWKN